MSNLCYTCTISLKRKNKGGFVVVCTELNAVQEKNADLGRKLEIKSYSEERDFENIIQSCKNENWTKFFLEKKEQFRKALKVSYTYVAYVDKRYCGFIRCITDSFFTIYCCEIIVDMEYRRMGIGRKLIQNVLEKFPNCSMDVLSDNDSFYQANNFIVLCNGMRTR